jgi:hypothetical protein
MQEMAEKIFTCLENRKKESLPLFSENFLETKRSCTLAEVVIALSLQRKNKK